MAEGILAMSASERERLCVIGEVQAGRLRQADAAARLDLSVRQVKRLVRALRVSGAAGLQSQRRGRVSPRRLSGDTAASILALLRGVYEGFGATLAAEMLQARDGIVVSRETVRKLQIAHGLRRGKRRRTPKRVHGPRERRARLGELIQIDGSPHDWLEGRGPRCCLIVFIDDATGRLMDLSFVPAETTQAYLAALQRHVTAFGVPLAFYSDKHGIFRVNAKDAASGDGKTEFGRVVERLGIELIHARTPQAKGRVERANQTLQDRLVKAPRLEGIQSLAAANAFLPGFIAQFNAKFAVTPRETSDAHRPWAQGPEALEDAIACQEERTLSKALTFRCKGRLHAVKPEGGSYGTALRGVKVMLHHHRDGTLAVRFKGRPLTVTAFGPSRAPQAAEDEKSLDARLDAVIARTSTAAMPHQAAV